MTSVSMLPSERLVKEEVNRDPQCGDSVIYVEFMQMYVPHGFTNRYHSPYSASLSGNEGVGITFKGLAQVRCPTWCCWPAK
jgi:hypothetical protein